MSAAVEHDPAVRAEKAGKARRLVVVESVGMLPRFSVASTMCVDTEDGTSTHG
jgi:hypothetical protein